MFAVYAPSRAPQFAHGVTSDTVLASRQPSAWEQQRSAADYQPSAAWSRSSASSVAELRRMSGAAAFQPRLSRPRSTGDMPRLRMSSVPADADDEAPHSNRAWNAAGWSPPPRRPAKSKKAPLSLADVQNKKLEADARALRGFEDSMAGFGPYPARPRRRMRRGWSNIDQQLRLAAAQHDKTLVEELATPRISEKSAAEIKDAERRKKGRRRAERMARSASTPSRDIVPVTAGSPPSGDVKTQPKRLPSGEIIDPQEHIARPSEASPYKQAVMPERFVSTIDAPTRPPAKIKKADGREVEKHSSSGKFGVDTNSAMAVSLLFESVQQEPDDDDDDAVQESAEEASPVLAAPGGSVIGIAGYQYDRRPHAIEDVERLRAAQTTAQDNGQYTQVAELASKILALDAPEQFEAQQVARAEAEEAAAKEREAERVAAEKAAAKAKQEAGEEAEREAAAVAARAADLVRNSKFATQQVSLLQEEQKRRRWQEKRPAPHPIHRHAHMWEEEPTAPQRPAVRSSPPRKVDLLDRKEVEAKMALLEAAEAGSP